MYSHLSSNPLELFWRVRGRYGTWNTLFGIAGNIYVRETGFIFTGVLGGRVIRKHVPKEYQWPATFGLSLFGGVMTQPSDTLGTFQLNAALQPKRFHNPTLGFPSTWEIIKGLRHEFKPIKLVKHLQTGVFARSAGIFTYMAADKLIGDRVALWMERRAEQQRQTSIVRASMFYPVPLKKPQLEPQAPANVSDTGVRVKRMRQQFYDVFRDF